jgi:hypothetical protein
MKERTPVGRVASRLECRFLQGGPWFECSMVHLFTYNISMLARYLIAGSIQVRWLLFTTLRLVREVRVE